MEAGSGLADHRGRLLGKVLGPIGMVMSFSDDWPRRLGMICVYNDLIWWLPFGLFLVRGTWLARAARGARAVAMRRDARGGAGDAGDLVAAWDARGTGAAARELSYVADHSTAWSARLGDMDGGGG